MPPSFNLNFLRGAPYKVIKHPPPEETENKLSPHIKKPNKQKKNAKTGSFIEVANNVHGHFREVFQAVIHLFPRNPAKSRSQNDKPSDI